ncbi:MAG: hypothetical protein LBT16_13525 [Treponema sp.]|jgi:xylulokinase|nr:hypothetical protein [Treponema sp.]
MLLVIDIGTSNFKAALADFNGRLIRTVSLPMAMQSAEEGRYETDPALWLRSFSEAVSRLGSVSRVEALVISGNGPTVTPVTGEISTVRGELVCGAAMARLWLDRRAAAEAETVSAIMGAYVDPGFFLPKILAIKNRESALYERTRYFLAAPEFLLFALTGEARTVFPSEGFDQWYWNDAALEKAGLDAEKFPPFVSPGDEIGTLPDSVASLFGFSKTVRVFAGGPDFFMSILGSGTVKPGQACDRSGTSEGLNVCTLERVIDRRLMSYRHPVKAYWNLSGIISTTGRAVDWCGDLLGIGRDYRSFYELAAKAAPGSGGVVFLPYLAGERAPLWDPKARGVFMGLNLETGREEAARSVAEGICFTLRDVASVMKELGAPISEIRVTNGAGKSGFLNQLKADITGKPVLVPERLDAEITGLAVLGAVSMGKYGSFEEAAGFMIRIGEQYYPKAENAACYDGLFREYRELYRALKPRFEGLAELREKVFKEL